MNCFSQEDIEHFKAEIEKRQLCEESEKGEDEIIETSEN